MTAVILTPAFDSAGDRDAGSAVRLSIATYASSAVSPNAKSMSLPLPSPVDRRSATMIWARVFSNVMPDLAFATRSRSLQADMSSLRCLLGCTENPTVHPLVFAAPPSFISARFAAICAIAVPRPVIAPSCSFEESASWLTCSAIVAFVGLPPSFGPPK